MVSKLNPVQRSVTVEWYERGETKGKEVELDMLLALNPDLLHTNRQSFVVPPPATTIQAPINLQRVSVLLFFFKKKFSLRNENISCASHLSK
jgi:kinesin family member 2/24